MATHSLFAKGAAALAAIALAVGIGGVSAAQADEAPTPQAGTITITAPVAQADDNMKPPTFTGREFTAYQLASYVSPQTNADHTAITGYGLANAAGVNDADVLSWIGAAAVTNGTVDPNLRSVLNASGGTLTFTGEAADLTPIEFVAKYFYGTGTDRYGNQMANSLQVRLFTDAAATSGKLKDGTTATVSPTQAQFTGLNEGLYLIDETDSQSGSAQTVSRAMITGTPMTVDGKAYAEVESSDPARSFTLGSIALKAEQVETAKTVAETSSANNQIAQMQSQRVFTITTNVPDYTHEYSGIADPVFTVSDKPSTGVDPFTTTGAQATVDGLKLTATNGKGETSTLVEGTDYTVATRPDTANADYGFTITLTNPRALSGDTITATYKATVTTLTQALTNTATSNFSNDPYDAQSMGKASASMNLYTTRIAISKVAYDDAGTKLDGAQFSVTGANNAAVKFSTDGKGNYYVDPNGTETAVTAGDVAIYGLGADSDGATTYTFTETKAPEGYLLGANGKHVTFTVTVDPTYSDHDVTSVAFQAGSQDHKNFLDMTTPAMWQQNQTVQASAARQASNVFVGGTVSVENTKNASDFAKTGGEITRVLAAAPAPADSRTRANAHQLGLHHATVRPHPYPSTSQESPYRTCTPPIILLQGSTRGTCVHGSAGGTPSAHG